MTGTDPVKRISQNRLGEIDLKLSNRDRQILQMLRKLRFLRTNQVRRLFFFDYPIENKVSLTAAARTLRRLELYGVVSHQHRQIGGRNFGSEGKIWHLTEAGIRLMDLGKELDGKRKRIMEPSALFIKHILAVSECFVQLSEICRNESDMRLKTLCIEPDCWRIYEKNGKEISLRPDLYAETISEKYEDHWFVEMDLSTEDIQSTIIDKCRRYHEYYQTNKEQQATGVFPLVLWIAPTDERKQRMIEAIRGIFSKRYAHIFLVITPDELHTTLRNGAKKEDLC